MWSSDPAGRRTTRCFLWVTAVVLSGLLPGGYPAAAIDLASLQVLPQRGQSPDQARRDRYECHNWAVEQTGVVPQTEPGDRGREDDLRADRTARVVNGALIGAGIGGVARSVQHKDPGKGILAGAAVGAIIGAASVPDRNDAEIDEGTREYLRALSACLEGRGYAISRSANDAGVEIAAAD